MKVMIELTGNCNARCSFCPYHGKTGRSKGNKKLYLRSRPLLEALSKLAPLQPKVHFSGSGENLLHQDFKKISYQMASMGFQPRIITNGILIPKWLSPLNDCFSEVIVSLHGNERTHDRIVGVKGAYVEAISGLALLKNPKKRVAFVISGKNYLELPNFAEFCKREGFEVRFQHNFLPSNENIDLECLSKAINAAREAFPSAEFLPELSKSQIKAYYLPGRHIVNPHYCAHIENAISIRSSGEVNCCKSGPFGNIYDLGIMEIIRGGPRARFIAGVKAEMASDGGIQDPLCDRCCYQSPPKAKKTEKC